MLTFFRKIRKGLLGDGVTSRYLLYAIGEIALVVIGILIALKINNWNNERLRNIQEIELLESFVIELNAHIDRIDEIVTFNSHVLGAAEELRSILEDRTPYHPRMDSLFYISTTFTLGDQFSSAALDNLKSAGIGIIKNQQLRNEIILGYDKFSYLDEAQELYVSMITDAGKRVFSTRFEELWDGDMKSVLPKGVMHPHDYESLFDDREYLYFLRSIPNHLGWFVFKPCNYTKAALEDILKSIEYELDNR